MYKWQKFTDLSANCWIQNCLLRSRFGTLNRFISRVSEVKKFRHTELYIISIIKSRFESELLVVVNFLLNQDLDCSKWPSLLNIGHRASAMVRMSLYYWWLLLNKKLHWKNLRISISKITFVGLINIWQFNPSFDQFILIFRPSCI